MTQERLSVRTIREVLRLKHEIGLSNRAIARACRISNSTVGEYITRAKQAGWTWPLPEEVSEDDLYRRLFPEEEKPKGTDRPVPNWEEIHRDLSRRGVTLRLLWREYREKHPDGYGSGMFCLFPSGWRQTRLSCRHPGRK